MPTFEGKRQRRPRVLAAAFAVAGAAIAACAIVVARDHAHAEAYLPWIAIPAMIAFWVLLMASAVPARASLTIEGAEVRASWRARPLRVSRVEVGRWVLGGVDTPTGALLVLTGDDGARLRVGGRDHDGAGYPRGPRVRAVDLAIDADDFDALAAQLGVARGDTREVEVELIKSSQTAGGLARMMGPWLLTMLGLSIGGVLLGVTGVGERVVSTRHGNEILGAIVLAIVIAGITLTVVRNARAAAPARIVRVTDDGLALEDADARVLARASWAEVTAARQRHLVRARTGTTTVAVLALAIGGESLVIGAYDAGDGWPDDVPRVRRAPRWLAGGAQWARLLAALAAHRRLQ